MDLESLLFFTNKLSVVSLANRLMYWNSQCQTTGDVFNSENISGLDRFAFPEIFQKLPDVNLESITSRTSFKNFSMPQMWHLHSKKNEASNAPKLIL